jgi:hypothetical protein
VSSRAWLAKPNKGVVDSILLFRAGFPAGCASGVGRVLDVVGGLELEPHTDSFGSVRLEHESVQLLARTYVSSELSFPHQLWAPNPNLVGSSSVEREIYACIHAVDSSGYVREKVASLVVDGDHEWSIPYLFQLASDYVGPVAERVAERLPNISAARRNGVLEFAIRNPQWIALLTRRIVSRWNLNSHTRDPSYMGYANYERFNEYPSFRIFDSLGLWPTGLTPRLLRKTQPKRT